MRLQNFVGLKIVSKQWRNTIRNTEREKYGRVGKREQQPR